MRTEAQIIKKIKDIKKEIKRRNDSIKKYMAEDGFVDDRFLHDTDRLTDTVTILDWVKSS